MLAVNAVNARFMVWVQYWKEPSTHWGDRSNFIFLNSSLQFFSFCFRLKSGAAVPLCLIYSFLFLSTIIIIIIIINYFFTFMNLVLNDVQNKVDLRFKKQKYCKLFVCLFVFLINVIWIDMNICIPGGRDQGLGVGMPQLWKCRITMTHTHQESLGLGSYFAKKRKCARTSWSVLTHH